MGDEVARPPRRAVSSGSSSSEMELRCRSSARRGVRDEAMIEGR